ncbi:hypothetical protein NG798_01190 [Ancylothrix sp. C2]|uniref:hypothetical protein n=1 Tax=Ancylothrix sp. D3o TaxID=2953691 RepID=UPI0021BA4033|nr:hypothetical protein [Ancylothrix sp. D3o]MCT7948395.1 hypothetical protein [Ancylothrix sp. D3o]
MLKKSWRSLLVAGLIAIPAVAIPAQSAKTQTDDLVFKLVNNTSKTIVDFRVDPSSQQNWGENILSEPVPPRETIPVIIADDRTDCTYDMYTKWSDDTDKVELNVNMCELGTWEYKE